MPTFSLDRGVFSLVLIFALHWGPIPVGLRPLSPCLHNVSALPVICFPEPLFAHMLCITQHCTHRLLATLCSPLALQVRIRQLVNVRPTNARPTQPGMDSFSRSFCRFPRVRRLGSKVLPYSVFHVLGAATLARAVAYNSYWRLSEYGCTVLCSVL
jgi:hypothetical protein